MGVMTLQITKIQLFVENMFQANNKEIIQAPHYWPFVRLIH